MKISFSTIVCHDYTLTQIANAARQHGYDGVELYGLEGERLTVERLEGRVDEVRQTMAGIELAAIHSWTALDYRESEERRRRVATIARMLELASSLEIPRVKIFGDELPADLSRDDAFDSMADAVRPLARRARELGVMLMIESHDGLPRAVDVLGVLSRVDDPALGALWDIFHPHRRGEDVQEAFDLFGDRVVHVHAKDNARHPGQFQNRFKGWQAVPPGEGEVPLREAFALLSRRGYDGFISVDAERMGQLALYPEPEVILAQYAQALPGLIAASA